MVQVMHDIIEVSFALMTSNFHLLLWLWLSFDTSLGTNSNLYIFHVHLHLKSTSHKADVHLLKYWKALKCHKGMHSSINIRYQFPVVMVSRNKMSLTNTFVKYFWLNSTACTESDFSDVNSMERMIHNVSKSDGTVSASISETITVNLVRNDKGLGLGLIDGMVRQSI